MSESGAEQQLSIFTLGGLTIQLDGQPVGNFPSCKIDALLVYLACTGRPQSREVLAELLWPERDTGRALGNLRWALHGLRKRLDPYLEIRRGSISLRREQIWLDVAELEAQRPFLQAGVGGVSPVGLKDLIAAVAHYQGEFLQGFKVRNSRRFEEWVCQVREHIHQLVLDYLMLITSWYQARGQYAAGIPFATRMLQLNPFEERAHRLKMQLLTHSGQPRAALAQYEACLQLLAEELGVSPVEETTRLYEQIQAGKVDVITLPRARETETFIPHPAFLDDKRQAGVERPLFVDREDELAQLMGYLDTALAGRGRVAFITGGPGRGKTTLMDEFAWRAQSIHPNLIVASGKGNAYTGIGDPYLPFREVLSQMTGDVEAQLVAGVMSSEQVRRLWNLMPFTVSTILELSPDLIGTFLSGTTLLGRARAYAPSGAGWLTRLSELVEHKEARPHDPSLQQGALFQQYVRVLQTVSRYRPLLLVLDDLQWADLGSIDLLFHLGRALTGESILIIGAYRPEEVALGRASAASGRWERHPLGSVINEFQRQFEDIEVDLAKAQAQRFINALLDTLPNRLGSTFRQTLRRLTNGHPLFTVELLRGLQERGDLILDETGGWVEGPVLDWERLPPRVEAVIAERIERLERPLREVLRVASVEGEVFTAEVVAQVQAVDVGEMVEYLSGELSRRHRLVRVQGFQRINEQCLSQYRFRHILFQKYLYNHTDPVERAYIHERVGRALETLCEGQLEQVASIAPQMARHFQEAGITDKAIDYLQQAGERALRMSANQEAIDYLTQALALLATFPDSRQRAQQELAIQLNLAMPLQSVRGYAAPEVGHLYTRMRELCEQVGDTPLLFPVLWLAHSYYTVRAELQTAIETADQLLILAEHAGDPVLMAMAHWALGWIQRCRGEFETARAHLERVVAWYDPQQHHYLTFHYAQDPGVVCRSQLAIVLWVLGYPDQARKCSQEALALAQDIPHPFSIAFSQLICASVNSFCRDAPKSQELAEALIDLSTEHGFMHWLALGNYFRGFALISQGQIEEGITQARQSIADYQATGAALDYSLYLAGLIEGYMKTGQTEACRVMIDDALAFVEQTGERYGEAALNGLQGEILQMQGVDEAEVERCFWKGIQAARRQHAKSWELRVTMTLCRLWQKQGKREDARQLLAEIYGWFTEGFDTGDLKEARALLEELS